MTELREAFCKMLEAYPGPDADEYTRWARSGDQEDTRELTGYVQSSIKAIERVGGDDERAHLPMLRALHAELTSGERAERGLGPETSEIGIIVEGEARSVVRGQGAVYTSDGRLWRLSWGETCPETYLGYEPGRARSPAAQATASFTPEQASTPDAPEDRWAKARKDQVFCGLFLRCLTSLDVTTAKARADAALEALEASGLVEAMHDVLTNRSVWAPDNIPVDVR